MVCIHEYLVLDWCLTVGIVYLVDSPGKRETGLLPPTEGHSILPHLCFIPCRQNSQVLTQKKHNVNVKKSSITFKNTRSLPNEVQTLGAL